MDKVVHFEITADDMQRAQEFYHKAFGWNIQNIPEMNYTIVTTSPLDDKRMHIDKGAINGGIMKKDGPIQHPVITIGVANIEHAIQKVKDAGGHVIKEPYQVAEMGIAAYIKDTEGNIMGLWQALNA